ncbi:hypothetical protein Q3G72_017793 [Acer saccharum]|nr:hypothetical protein Q3G72_017793 [Acer saccharum]
MNCRGGAGHPKLHTTFANIKFNCGDRGPWSRASSSLSTRRPSISTGLQFQSQVTILHCRQIAAEPSVVSHSED